MGQTIGLQASDGHDLSAYEASPKGKHRGGLVVIQEIFGVNEHIRSVTDGYAADGYYCVAPAIFDRDEARRRTRLRAGGVRRRGRSMREDRHRQHAARRRGGASRGGFGGEGRRRRLLPRRLARLARGDAAARHRRRVLLLRRHASQPSRARSRAARCRCISATRISRSRWRTWRRSAPACRRAGRDLRLSRRPRLQPRRRRELRAAIRQARARAHAEAFPGAYRVIDQGNEWWLERDELPRYWLNFGRALLTGEKGDFE